MDPLFYPKFVFCLAICKFINCALILSLQIKLHIRRLHFGKQELKCCRQEPKFDKPEILNGKLDFNPNITKQKA